MHGPPPAQLPLTPIGYIETGYPEKFGVPRQPGLVDSDADIVLQGEYGQSEAYEGLESFSHIWVLFWFHHNRNSTAESREAAPGERVSSSQGRNNMTSWKPKVRPPRLGGNQSMGVFATRSPYRPNPIGLSALALHGIEKRPGEVRLKVKGADLVDGTPILDIKPYLPYTDRIEASSGFAPSPPAPRLTVQYSDAAERVLSAIDESDQLRKLIAETLALDPRPAYAQDSVSKVYGISLYDRNIRWRCTGGVAFVDRIEPRGKSG